MFNHLRLSYNLLRLANSVLDRRKEKFKKELESLDLSERVLEETLDCLVGIKDHLVRKMCVHWLKKKSIILPEDLPKVEKAYKLAKDNRGIDYLTFDSPVEIIEQFEEKAQIEFDKLIKPDSLPELYNKVDLGEGVTVYTVEDTKEGQYAVRRLADSHFGERFDNWCIIYRLRDKKDVERDDMGMMVKSYEAYWNNYNAYPKRLAFKDGKLFAFCANEYRAILWWDQNDKQFGYIPKHSHLGDDKKFINKYYYEIGDDFETDIKRMGKLDIKRALKSDKISIDFKLKLIPLAKTPERISLARNPNTPIEVLVKLSNDEDWKVRYIVAKNPNTPVDVLVKMSNDENEDIRQDIAKNPNTPVEVLVKLSNDEDKLVRFYIAKNPNTPVEVLVKLSNDEESLVRSMVAGTPNTPIDTLIELSSDEKGNVRSSVAENSKTPIDVLTELSRDEGYDIRQAIAGNLNTPVDVLVKLSEDEEYRVCKAVAKNPNAPDDALVKLSKNRRIDVRQAVAEHPNTPADVLVKLSNDEEWEVREYIVGNPNIPDEVLVKLSNDRNEYVRYIVAKNPNTPVDVLVKLSENENEYVLQGVAENPNTPVDVLVKLFENENEYILQGIAENPNAPVEILVKISKDSVETVRNIAIENLRKRGVNV